MWKRRSKKPIPAYWTPASLPASLPASSKPTEKNNATVELTDWNLKQKDSGKFYLQGIKRNDPLKRLWRSSTLRKRVDNRSFMTISNVKYRLIGNMNYQIATKEDGWPFHLIEKYSEGIPHKWKHAIQTTFGRRLSCVRSPPESLYSLRKVESNNGRITRNDSMDVDAAITVGCLMKKTALSLIRQNVSLLKHACSTPRKNSHENTTEMPDIICGLSPVRDDFPPPVTKKRCRKMGDGNLGNTFHHQQSRAKRRKRSLAVSFDEDSHCSFDEVPPSNSPIEAIPPVATSKPPPVILPMIELTQEAVSCMQNCCVVLRDINSKSSAENKTTKKAFKGTKAQPIRAGNKGQKLKTTAAENLEVTCAEQVEKPKLGRKPKPTAAENLEMTCNEQAEKPKLNKDVMKRYEAITAKPGTLKRKQQMRQFLIEHNYNAEETDFLSKEVPNEGLNKMIGDFIANDEFSLVTDVSSASEGETPRRQNVIMTPVSEGKTPAASTFDPTYHRNRNRQHIDKYVLQRNAEIKLNAKRPTILKPTVIKKKSKHQFIPLNKVKLLFLRTDSDEENEEGSGEENY